LRIKKLLNPVTPEAPHLVPNDTLMSANHHHIEQPSQHTESSVEQAIPIAITLLNAIGAQSSREDPMS